MNQRSLEETPTALCKKDLSLCTDQELYIGLPLPVKGTARERAAARGKRKLYYIPAELLIEKLLFNNLINLGAYDNVKDILAEHGKSLNRMKDTEPEPSLDSGGLGHLAACFLDSIATFGLDGDRIGLNYRFGLFKQLFYSSLQDEKPGSWIENTSWLTKTNATYQVSYEGFIFTSRMYDVQVTGHGSRINTLHLLDVETVDKSLVTKDISSDKTDVEKDLTLFLYPDDSDGAGQTPRICQRYFVVGNVVWLILAEALEKGFTFYDLSGYAMIQVNDTRPAMVIPGLIRLLTSEHGMEMDDVTQVVSRTCAYTNHTIPAEALETWPVEYSKDTVPQLIPIMEILDDRVRRKFGDQLVAITDRGGRVHMAHINTHYGFSTNGVTVLHVDILKENEFHNFYRIHPGKFNDKTNEITFRRWLLRCNPQLSAFIGGLTGEGFKEDAMELQNLSGPAFTGNIETLHRLLSIRGSKKEDLAVYFKETQGLDVNPQFIFDIQTRRLHEYKRQQMNALYLIHKYLEIKQGKKSTTPITVTFRAKATPAYVIAKDTIHMTLCLQQITDNDSNVKPRLQVVVVSNYSVTLAEELIPACDISEQISLAPREASGAGNVKSMLNGAVTLSADDGANVEIHQLVGDDNIYTLGDSGQTVTGRYKDRDYCSRDYYKSNPIIREAVDPIAGPAMLAAGCKGNLTRLSDELLNKDWFMTFPDFDIYCKTKEQVYSDYGSRTQRAKRMLVNISQVGLFSSNYTILEYNRDIWKLDEEQHTTEGVIVINLP